MEYWISIKSAKKISCIDRECSQTHIVEWTLVQTGYVLWYHLCKGCVSRILSQYTSFCDMKEMASSTFELQINMQQP